MFDAAFGNVGIGMNSKALPRITQLLCEHAGRLY